MTITMPLLIFMDHFRFFLLQAGLEPCLRYCIHITFFVSSLFIDLHYSMRKQQIQFPRRPFFFFLLAWQLTSTLY